MVTRSRIHSGALALALVLVVGCYDPPPDIQLITYRPAGVAPTRPNLHVCICQPPLDTCQKETLLGAQEENFNTHAIYVAAGIDTLVLQLVVSTEDPPRCVTIGLRPSMLEREFDLRKLPEDRWSCLDGGTCETLMDCSNPQPAC